MQNTLSEMWKRYNLLLSFKNEMNLRGYASKDLYSIEIQMEVLMELIHVESENVLEVLIKEKTYFRLLKKINRGVEYLINIIESPEEWILNKIENDIDAWIDSDVLIFSCRNVTAVFSKLSRKSDGAKYNDGKFQ